MKIEIPIKIRAEDFKEDDRAVASGIGGIYNSFVDNLYFMLQKRVDFENLNQDKVSVTVTIGPSGSVVNPPAVKHKCSKPTGAICIAATCLTNNQTFPTGTPFITLGYPNSSTVSILNATNLQPNTQYNLVIILIG